MKRDIAEGEFEKGDKVTLEYTDSDGNKVSEEKTVRMVMPDMNAILFHFDRELVEFPVVEGDSGRVEGKLGNFKGYNPRLA